MATVYSAIVVPLGHTGTVPQPTVLVYWGVGGWPWLLGIEDMAPFHGAWNYLFWTNISFFMRQKKNLLIPWKVGEGG